MPPLSLAVAARPAALNAFNRPLIARSAAPQALRRTWGARRWRRASTSSGGGSDDDEQAGPDSSAGSSSSHPKYSPGSNSGGSSGGSNSTGADSGGPAQVAQRGTGKQVPVPPGLEAQLAQLAEQYGGSKAALSKAVAAMRKTCQAWFAEHSCDVAAWLHSQGITQAQLQQLLLRCPALFSWPVEERAGVLFGQLQQLGLSAAEAARCFEKQPCAINVPSFTPAMDVLVPLFAAAAGSKGAAPAGHQLLGAVLRELPAAVELLEFSVKALEQRVGYLLGLGLSEAQLVQALAQSVGLLFRSPAHLTALEAVLQQELAAGRGLFAKVLRRAPRVRTCSEGTVRCRARALVQAFARQRTLHMVGKAPDLLAINSCVWQTALAVMQLCGLAQTEALEVASSNPQALCVDWLAADKLVNRLVLQRCLPGGPSAGQVYERHAGHVAGKSAERLAGRLLFLQHHGLLHLLVENKGEARREWRRLHGFRADRRAAGEPAFISLSDLSKPDAHLASLPAVQAAGGLPALQAFMAELKFSPAWLELEAAAEAERARLLGLLPEDLRQAAEKRRQAADEKEQ